VFPLLGSHDRTRYPPSRAADTRRTIAQRQGAGLSREITAPDARGALPARRSERGSVVRRERAEILDEEQLNMPDDPPVNPDIRAYPPEAVLTIRLTSEIWASSDAGATAQRRAVRSA
jgi:hypothetical protein